MKLRLRRSVLGNAHFGLVVGLALVSGVGCSDDDSIPEVPMFDGGGSSETTSPIDTDTTNGGGGGTTDPADTSDTSDPTDTLDVNPTDETSSTSPIDPTETTGDPTGDTSSLHLTSDPTSETMAPTSAPTSDPGASSDPGSSSEEFPNLIANGDFESGSTGWSTWNGTTLAVSTAKARSGQQSLMASGGTGTGPIATTISPLVPGGTYEVTFWASVGTGSASVRIVRDLVCADNRYLWVVGNTTVSSTGWTELTGQFTVPDDCESTSFQVYAEGDAAGVDLYVDDVSVTLLPSDDTSGTDTSGVSTDVTDTMDPGTTGMDVDSGVVDTGETMEDPDASVDTGETTMDPDAGDASTTEPVDTTDEVLTEADASISTGEETTETPDPYGPNIIVNSTFEDHGGWWFPTGGTITRTDAQSHTGLWSLVTDGRAETYQGPAVNLLSDSFANPPVEPGKTYHLEAYVRLTAGNDPTNVQFSIALNCDETPDYPLVGQAQASDAGWVLVEGDFTVPTICVELSQYQLYAQGPATTVNFYIDDVTVREVLMIP